MQISPKNILIDGSGEMLKIVAKHAAIAQYIVLQSLTMSIHSIKYLECLIKERPPRRKASFLAKE